MEELASSQDRWDRNGRFQPCNGAPSAIPYGDRKGYLKTKERVENKGRKYGVVLSSRSAVENRRNENG